MKRPVARTLLALSAAMLSACAGSSADYPSLSIRDFERGQGSLEVPEGTADIRPSPLPADKIARIAALRTQIGDSHAKFMAEAPAARSAVRGAAGTSVGDDRWAGAQVALASLESQRSQSAVWLTDLDILFVDTTLEFEQREAVAEARDEATRLVRAEDEILAELRAALGN